MHAFLDALPIIIGGTTVAILGGLADIAWRQRRQARAQDQWHSDISQAVLGEPGRQGVPEIPSLRQRLDLMAQKVESLSNRPAMNGGFSKLQGDMRDVKAGQDRLNRGQVAGQEAADRAARQAALAAELAAAASEKAREAVELAQRNHEELKQRLDNNDLIGQTMLTTLAEQHQIDLRPQMGGELTGSLHVTLRPEDSE